MQYILVESFGGPEVLTLKQASTPIPSEGQVLVKTLSIGLNRAEVIGRKGLYKASTGEPPFVPGIEAGGVIEQVGPGVDSTRIGQRVVLAPGIPRGVHGLHGGTYRTHIIVDTGLALEAPDALPDNQLGAVILPYLTAYGCLIQHHQLQPGSIVAIPAATSSVGLAAAQVVKRAGGTAIGLTSSPDKVEAVQALPTAAFDHIVVTHDEDKQLKPFRRELKQLTDGHGVDVFFDPVAAGAYLQDEILSLAKGGTLYIYGLLGTPDRVDVTPLIIKQAKIEGWVLERTIAKGEVAWRQACQEVFEGFATGAYQQHIAESFALTDVQQAHALMAKNKHIGKMVLIP